MKHGLPLTWALVASMSMLPQGTVFGAPSEVQVDPTRPPAFVSIDSADQKAAHARVLQSVLIAPGRTMAIIDGEPVRVGSRIGDARVMRIDETGVILSQGGKTEALMLFPEAKKSSPGRSQLGQRTNQARAK